MLIKILGLGLVRDQVSWLKPESQRTEPGQRLNLSKRKGEVCSLNQYLCGIVSTNLFIFF
jgi:hypothetical protein